MKIKVRLFATLSKYNCTSEINRQGTIEASAGCTVRDVMGMLSIPEEEVKLISLNGAYSNLKQTLNPEDRLCMFPPVKS
jgi:molybdopterin converting factor small subunit